MKKLTAAAAIGLGMAACLGTGVYAGSNLTEIKAYLNGNIQIKYNGNPVQLLNDQGQVQLPITYNGTTYLPIKAVSTILKTAVSYEPQTNTVFLGEKLEGVSIAKGFSSDWHTQDPQVTVYQGKDYKDVFFNNYASTRSAGFILEPEGKYQKLELQMAAIGADISEVTIKDTDTDVVLKKVPLPVSDGLKTVEVNIAGSKNLYVSVVRIEENGSWFVPLTTSYYK
ncbi:hypothetical protein [Paenibacillus pinistramenti]|uniref:hypothetical protein n=1 Tax=Paenibacillus pinistramenti TaxID=1768003 RepID=UPI0011096D87|nr:hypothetical protein [Paenibacillus pinistramenti]